MGRKPTLVKEVRFTSPYVFRARPRHARPKRRLETLHDLPVLVVDDNQTNRLICHELLSNWGMKSTVTASGPAALDALRQRVGIGPTVPTGAAGCDDARHGWVRNGGANAEVADFDQAAVIMLSSADRSEDKQRAARMGVARCLTKPVTQSQLFNAIAQSLGTAVADARPFDSIHSDRPGDFVPRRILLAEDGIVNQKVAVDLLTKRGHHVTLANNGQEALSALDEQDFDLILMDIQMPVMDGFAATAAIRKRESGSQRHLPIIAMTAHAMAGDRERCLKAGMDAYVAKPFRPQELFRAVEDIDPLLPSGRRSAVAEEGQGEGAQPQLTHDGAGTAEFDREEALTRVGGSEELLRELVELFRSECPKQMDEIRRQHAAGDLAGLARAAHTLKGSVSIFAAQTAYDAALRIEKMGRAGDASDFDDAWHNLQRRSTGSAPHSIVNSQRGQDMKVLIAEDNPIWRQMLKQNVMHVGLRAGGRRRRPRGVEYSAAAGRAAAGRPRLANAGHGWHRRLPPS